MFSRLDPTLIRGLRAFSTLEERDLVEILSVASTRKLEPGTAVFDQGETARSFFLLLHGRLKVVQTGADGSQITIRHVNPGELFGIAPALRRPDYPATASAIVESLAIAWPVSFWDDFVFKTPILAANTMQTMGSRLQEAHERIRELATEQVDKRLAHAILRLLRQAGREDADGISIDFPLTRQDIAELAGTTLHTVSRILNAWQARGIVSLGRKKVTVRDRSALARIADELSSAAPSH